MKSTPGNGNATEKVLAVLQALADNEPWDRPLDDLAARVRTAAR